MADLKAAAQNRLAFAQNSTCMKEQVILILKIAVCDDDALSCQRTRTLVSSYLLTHSVPGGNVWTCTDGNALLAQAEKQGGFDIYLLDILMPELNGIEIGRRLRARGDRGEIVYLTNSNDFAADSYDVQAFSYLLKPVDETRLFQVLNNAAEQLRRRRSCSAVIHTAQGPRCIPLEQIRYAERVGRVIRYFCTDGTVDSRSIRVPFREAVGPLLTSRCFCLCGVSFVLNLQHVTGVNGQTVMLDNGQTVALPKSAAADFKKAWGSYWLNVHDFPADC